MADSVFRTSTATPAPEPATKTVDESATDQSSESMVSVPELFATYEADQGKPYVADYFDLSNVWNQEDNLKNEINTIEGYLREQVAKGKVSNQTREVEKFIKDLEKKAGTNPYEPTTKRLSKLLAYIDFRRVVDE